MGSEGDAASDLDDPDGFEGPAVATGSGGFLASTGLGGEGGADELAAGFGTYTQSALGILERCDGILTGRWKRAGGAFVGGAGSSYDSELYAPETLMGGDDGVSAQRSGMADAAEASLADGTAFGGTCQRYQRPKRCLRIPDLFHNCGCGSHRSRWSSLCTARFISYLRLAESILDLRHLQLPDTLDIWIESPLSHNLHQRTKTLRSHRSNGLSAVSK
jgi:hypothetical protein